MAGKLYPVVFSQSDVLSDEIPNIHPLFSIDSWIHLFVAIFLFVSRVLEINLEVDFKASAFLRQSFILGLSEIFKQDKCITRR